MEDYLTGHWKARLLVEEGRVQTEFVATLYEDKTREHTAVCSVDDGRIDALAGKCLACTMCLTLAIDALLPTCGTPSHGDSVHALSFYALLGLTDHSNPHFTFTYNLPKQAGDGFSTESTSTSPKNPSAVRSSIQRFRSLEVASFHETLLLLSLPSPAS